MSGKFTFKGKAAAQTTATTEAPVVEQPVVAEVAPEVAAPVKRGRKSKETVVEQPLVVETAPEVADTESSEKSSLEVFKHKMQSTLQEIIPEQRVTLSMVTAVINAYNSCVVETLAEKGGANLNMRGFGIFRYKVRPAHTGRNPRTGEAVQISERTRLDFSPSAELRSME